jgi:hypothetical protein
MTSPYTIAKSCFFQFRHLADYLFEAAGAEKLYPGNCPYSGIRLQKLSHTTKLKYGSGVSRLANKFVSRSKEACSCGFSVSRFSTLPGCILLRTTEAVSLTGGIRRDTFREGKILFFGNVTAVLYLSVFVGGDTWTLRPPGTISCPLSSRRPLNGRTAAWYG